MNRRKAHIPALVLLSGLFLTACGDQPEGDNTSSQTEEHSRPAKGGEHDRRPGHPPEGERKGPPKDGRGPEQTKTLEEIGGYNFGETAADFNLKNVDGTMFSLSSIENAKGYIVAFTCNECPFSKMYEDRLIKLHQEYAPKGYSVVAINPNSSTENQDENYGSMQRRAKEKGFPFVYLYDDAKTYAHFGAVRTPHVFLLDKERKVQYIGTIDNNAKSAESVTEKYVENAIEALENGTSPDPKFTKAIGCPVKAG